MAKLMYEYEAGSGSDGSNSTFVIDSSLLLETYDEQNYTDVHFYSTNPTYCPIYECDIVTYLDI